MLDRPMLTHVDALRAANDEIKGRWYAATEEPRRQILDAVVDRRDIALATLAADATGVHDTDVREEVWVPLQEYARRSDWVLFDPIALAVCGDVAPAEIAARWVPNLLVYHAYRMVDDVLDGHLTYKGHYPTLFAQLREARPGAAEGLVLLPALGLLEAAVPALPERDRTAALATLWGALRETVGLATSDIAAYERMVAGKMVAYGRLLYGPAIPRHLDAAQRTVLERFLDDTFLVSQMANDLLDLEADRSRGQPNYWTLPGQDPSVEFVGRLDRLNEAIGGLPADVRAYGCARAADLCRYVAQICDGLAGSSAGGSACS
jgi:hypothetical protein